MVILEYEFKCDCSDFGIVLDIKLDCGSDSNGFWVSLYVLGGWVSFERGICIDREFYV